MTDNCMWFLIGWALGAIVGRCAKWLARDRKERKEHGEQSKVD